jgi:hypothetical protein
MPREQASKARFPTRTRTRGCARRGIGVVQPSPSKFFCIADATCRSRNQTRLTVFLFCGSYTRPPPPFSRTLKATQRRRRAYHALRRSHHPRHSQRRGGEEELRISASRSFCALDRCRKSDHASAAEISHPIVGLTQNCVNRYYILTLMISLDLRRCIYAYHAI